MEMEKKRAELIGEILDAGKDGKMIQQRNSVAGKELEAAVYELGDPGWW